MCCATVLWLWGRITKPQAKLGAGGGGGGEGVHIDFLTPSLSTQLHETTEPAQCAKHGQKSNCDCLSCDNLIKKWLSDLTRISEGMNVQCIATAFVVLRLWWE